MFYGEMASVIVSTEEDTIMELSNLTDSTQTTFLNSFTLRESEDFISSQSKLFSTRFHRYLRKGILDQMIKLWILILMFITCQITPILCQDFVGEYHNNHFITCLIFNIQSKKRYNLPNMA